MRTNIVQHDYRPQYKKKILQTKILKQGGSRIMSLAYFHDLQSL